MLMIENVRGIEGRVILEISTRRIFLMTPGKPSCVTLCGGGCVL